MVDRGELLAQALRRYPEFLRSLIDGAAFFPLELRIGKTRRAHSYGERAAELTEFHAAANALGLTVEWREVSDPRFGLHKRPERAFFADEGAYLEAIVKGREVRRFREDVALIRAECPALGSWLSANVAAVIRHHGVWPELLRVVRWFRVHPCSGLYLRQLPVEGVHTKFFEQYRAILDALLWHAQPEMVDAAASRFEARHGLRWEQPLVRLRFLDPLLQIERGFPTPDVAVPAPAFRTLALSGASAIVTENLRNFLALPPLLGAVAVFGSGDAATLLHGAAWLTMARLVYWGDMDPPGYAILARLRGEYPQTESILMDLPTLRAHEHLATKAAFAPPEASTLLPVERAALEYLCAHGLWLEQERIPFAEVVQTFARIFPPPG